MAINTTLSDVHSNDLLGAIRTEVQSTYENCMYNLYKFLDSAVEFTDQILTMQIAEAEAKAKLALEGINIFAVTPEPTPTFVKTDDNSSATAEAEGAISAAINQQAAGGITSAADVTHGGTGGSFAANTNQTTSAVNVNNNIYKAQYIDTGDQIADGATYMSDIAAELFNKNVPTWFWRIILRCEVGDNFINDAHFNNPGGMDYDSWMPQYCTNGTVVGEEFIDTGGALHTGAKFSSIWDGIVCEVAWFCRPGAYHWWAEEIEAAQRASSLADAENTIHMHVAHYVYGEESITTEVFHNGEISGAYYPVTGEEYPKGNYRTGDDQRTKR